MITKDVYEIGNVLLSKELIPSDTQENQIKYHLSHSDSPKPISYPELFYIGKELLNNNVKNKDKIIEFLRVSFERLWFQTSSGVLYGQAVDLIIHDKGMPSVKSFETNFTGPDRYIEKADESNLKLLTGLDSLDEIKEVSQFITERDKTYLWRINQRPSKDDYRAAGFSADSAGSLFGCYGRFGGSSCSFGVFVSSEGAQKISEIKKEFNLDEIKERLESVGITGELEKLVLEKF